MTDKVFVNADMTKIVKEGSPDAAWQLHRTEAERLGIIDKPVAEKARSTTDAVPAGTKVTTDGAALETTRRRAARK